MPRPSAAPLSLSGDRLVGKAETCRQMGVSYPKLWSMVQDSKFPRGRYFANRLYWLQSELDEMKASLPRQPRAGEPRPILRAPRGRPKAATQAAE
jgi:predicted DNA-binding transcriptional regulator AlpA